MTLPLRLIPSDGDEPRAGASEAESAGSYRRLAEVFHHLLSEQSLDALLERIADALADIVPYDALAIYEADESTRELRPLLARDRWADAILSQTCSFGEGITGWAVEHREPVLANDVHLDPRSKTVPGTPENEPEALVSIPLVARESIKGALNVYRLGEDVRFTGEEFELAKRFGDAAALALDNAKTRARLERQAQTDWLTGLDNHRAFHERLRIELARANRTHDSVALMMLDLDDFKRVNDVHGHGAGDEVLRQIAEILTSLVRVTDVVCRIGGEEFAVILPSCTAADAVGLAGRVNERLERTEFDAAGRISASIGLSEGPRHGMNPRDLIAYAETAMMTAKARGKGLVVVFGDGEAERPDADSSWRDMRSIAQLKMLQSLAGKLNRLNEVQRIGEVIVNELRAIVDYHNCRVYVVEGDEVVPIAFRGELGEYDEENVEILKCRLGEGICGTVAATGTSILLANALECEFAVQVPGTPDIDESIVAVPLLFGSRATGAIVLSKLGVGQFDENDVRLLEVLGGQASVALENARLYEAERREAESARESAEIARSLLEFGRELASAEGMEEVLGRTVELSARMLGSRKTSVWLQDGDSHELYAVALHGYGEEEAELVRALRFGPERSSALVGRLEPYAVGPDHLDGLGIDERIERTGAAVAPLRIDEGRVGCIVAMLDEPEHERGLRLLAGIANQAKLALATALSFESLERTFLETVESLANALEASDEYTSSHARTITDMALDVGRALGFDADALKRLELGALFHDIGKIGTPSHILVKPGPLTDEERSVIELHPQLGERILGPIAQLEAVRPIVRHCHEHWDGNGYPDGKAGEEIPIESRIILVCDAFHAMTSDRPYRKRLPVAEACRRLREGAGAQFDPAIVEAFLPLYEHGS
jgi:diguanylate cyclase (GGDEF)-like protein